MSYPFSRVLCCQKPFTDPLSAEYSRSREDYSGSRVPSGWGFRPLDSSSRQWLGFHLHRFHLQRAEDGRHGLLDIHHQHSVIFQQTVLAISSISKILRPNIYLRSPFMPVTPDYLYKVRFDIPTSSH